MFSGMEFTFDEVFLISVLSSYVGSFNVRDFGEQISKFKWLKGKSGSCSRCILIPEIFDLR